MAEQDRVVFRKADRNKMINNKSTYLQVLDRELRNVAFNHLVRMGVKEGIAEDFVASLSHVELTAFFTENLRDLARVL